MTMIEGLRVEDEPEGELWGVDEATIRHWGKLIPGASVTVVKRSAKHHGEERARYPGTVIASSLPKPWIEIEARWTMPPHQQSLLTFKPGDILREIYSPIHPFDAFAVYTPDGEFKGWYANVAYPVLLEQTDNGSLVVWRDLFIDIVAMPDGTVTVLDEDELAEFGLAETDPQLTARIFTARDHLLDRFRQREAPFHRSRIA